MGKNDYRGYSIALTFTAYLARNKIYRLIIEIMIHLDV